MKYPRITDLGNICNADNATLRECIAECGCLYSRTGNADYLHCARSCAREIKRRDRFYSDLIDQ